MRINWWPHVIGFAAKMHQRFMEKEIDGWLGAEDVPEEQYCQRAVKNITNGNYIDAANLSMLAFMARKKANKDLAARIKKVIKEALSDEL